MRALSLLILQLSSVLTMLTNNSEAAATGNAAGIPTMSIEGRLQYPNKMPYNITTPIIVNHGEFTTYSRNDGNFTIHDIVPGVYLIDVQSPMHHFSQIKCLYKPEAIQENKPIFSCLEYHYPGAVKQPVENMLVISALGTYDYFELKRGFSVMSLIKNPMVIMMILSAGMMYMLPKMMENMDPEERAIMQKQMSRQQNPQQMFGELLSGFTTTAEEAPKHDVAPAILAPKITETKPSKQQRKSRK
jgi:ER membrane protein complex subunit 7